MANFSTILSNGLAVHLRGYLSGLTLSTAGGSAIFGVSAGVAVDSVQKDFMNLSSAFTKTTSSWAVGSGNGSLDTGSIAAATWYYVFLIKRPDTGVVDILTSLSATAPTMPTNYTLFRRIGAMLTVAGIVWVQFTQVDSNFYWTTPRQDINAATLNTTSLLFTLSVPPLIPVIADFNATVNNSASGAHALFQSTAHVTQTGNVPAGNLNVDAPSTAIAAGARFQLYTNTGQLRAVSLSAANGTYNVVTNGWEDTRGIWS